MLYLIKFSWLPWPGLELETQSAIILLWIWASLNCEFLIFWYENRRKLHRILNCGQINKCLHLRNPSFNMFTWSCMYGSLPLPASFLSIFLSPPPQLSHSLPSYFKYTCTASPSTPSSCAGYGCGEVSDVSYRYFTQTLCYRLDPVWDVQLSSRCSHCLSNLRFAFGYFLYLIRYIVIRMMFLKLSKKQRFVFL